MKAVSQNSMAGWKRFGTRPVTRESFQMRMDFDGDSARSPDSTSMVIELSDGVLGFRRDAEDGGGGVDGGALGALASAALDSLSLAVKSF